MIFAFLYYKLLVKDLIGYEAKGSLGVAAFIELMVELGLLATLVGHFL